MTKNNLVRKWRIVLASKCVEWCKQQGPCIPQNRSEGGLPHTQRAGEALIVCLGSQHGWVPLWNVCLDALMHLAWGTNKRNYMFAWSCRAVISLRSWRYGGIVHTTGVLRYVCTGSLRRAGLEGGEGELSFMQHSSWNAWRSAVRRMIDWELVGYD